MDRQKEYKLELLDRVTTQLKDYIRSNSDLSLKTSNKIKYQIQFNEMVIENFKTVEYSNAYLNTQLDTNLKVLEENLLRNTSIFEAIEQELLDD